MESHRKYNKTIIQSNVAFQTVDPCQTTSVIEIHKYNMKKNPKWIDSFIIFQSASCAGFYVLASDSQSTLIVCLSGCEAPPCAVH